MATAGTAKNPAIYCRRCGYDLRASGPARRCPECGHHFSPDDPHTYARRPPRSTLRRWTQRSILFLLALLLVLAASWLWLYRGWQSDRQTRTSLKATICEVAPLGGPAGVDVKRWLGRAGWVLDRTSYVALAPPATDADLAYVADLGELRGLVLSGTRITDAGLVHIKKLKGLEMLQLSYTPITDVGLAQLKEVKSLQTLFLTDTRVTDAGLAHLKELKGLQALELSGTQVTDAGVRELRAALPGCQISGP